LDIVAKCSASRAHLDVRNGYSSTPATSRLFFPAFCKPPKPTNPTIFAATSAPKPTPAAMSPIHFYDANNVVAARWMLMAICTGILNSVGKLIVERTYGDRIPDGVSLLTMPEPASIAGMDPYNFRETNTVTTPTIS